MPGVKPMSGDWSGLYRLWHGDLRVIYLHDRTEDVIVIAHVGPRGDIYKYAVKAGFRSHPAAPSAQPPFLLSLFSFPKLSEALWERSAHPGPPHGIPKCQTYLPVWARRLTNSWLLEA